MAKTSDVKADVKPTTTETSKPVITPASFNGYDISITRENGQPGFVWSVVGTSDTDDNGEYVSAWATVEIGRGCAKSIDFAQKQILRAIAAAEDDS